jgi:hypothetical protein
MLNVSGVRCHRVTETGKPYVSFGSEKTRASFSFLPEQQLYSIGVLGVPAIPVFAGATPASTLALNVELTMKENDVFSFKSSPCLVLGTNNELCPSLVRLSIRAQSDDMKSKNLDGSPMYGYIQAFNSIDAMLVTLEPAESAESITDQDIYQHFGYRNQPEWVVLHARLTYVYNCSGACPTSFSLSADGMIDAGTLRSTGTYEFEKMKMKDYDALTPVQ